MALLGQQKRFDAFDFCYHMMRVHNVDHQDAEMLQGASVSATVLSVLSSFTVLSSLPKEGVYIPPTYVHVHVRSSSTCV